MRVKEIGRTRARSELGAALRAARRAHGFTQTQLEWSSGVDQTTISRIERGEPVALRFKTYVRLLDALSVEGVRVVVRGGLVADYSGDTHNGEKRRSGGIEERQSQP